MLKKKSGPKKVVLCGGGTGGHIFPIIAIAEILKKENCDLYYIGVNGKPEEKIADEHKIDFYGYEFSGFPRKIQKELLIWPLNLLKAVTKARVYLKHFKPDIVFGTGGYSAAPVFIAAKRLGIPYIVHNLDVRLGLANKFCASGADLLTLGFDLQEEILTKTKKLVTGNPARKSFYEISKKDKDKTYKEFNLDPKKKTIFIICGSQGANVVNEIVLDIIKDLVLVNDIQVIHQIGESSYEKFAKRIPAKVEEKGSYITKSFFEEPEKCYHISDLVISRSGAMTVSEITTLGKPAIFIPYPFAGNHQEANAIHLVNAGGAILLRQKELNPKELLTNILNLINNEKKLSDMSRITLSFAMPNAAAVIANLILSTVNNSKGKLGEDKEIFSTTL